MTCEEAEDDCWKDFDLAYEEEREDILRDKIALTMMSKYMANKSMLSWLTVNDFDECANFAYGVADAMIKRRKERR